MPGPHRAIVAIANDVPPMKYDDLAQERPGPAARGGEMPRQVLVVVVVMPMLGLIVTTSDPIARRQVHTRGRACRCPDSGADPLGEWGLQLCVCWCVGLETSLGVLCVMPASARMAWPASPMAIHTAASAASASPGSSKLAGIKSSTLLIHCRRCRSWKSSPKSVQS